MTSGDRGSVVDRLRHRLSGDEEAIERIVAASLATRRPSRRSAPRLLAIAAATTLIALIVWLAPAVTRRSPTSTATPQLYIVHHSSAASPVDGGSPIAPKSRLLLVVHGDHP